MGGPSLDPWTVLRTSRTIADSEIVCRRQGSGSAIVVLHRSIGLPGWLPIFDRLAEDHAVVVPDLPGFGQSACPTWARDVRDIAIMLGLWLDEEALEHVTIVGLGFGGWIATELATLAPLRLDNLVLVGAARLLPRDGRINDQMLISHTRYVRAHFAAPSKFETFYGSEASDDTLLSWEISREMTARVAWKPYMYNRRLETLLPSIHVPTLVVWGGDDEVVPLECGHRYSALLPDASLEVIAGGGHAVEMEQPDEVATMILSHAGARKAS